MKRSFMKVAKMLKGHDVRLNMLIVHVAISMPI